MLKCASELFLFSLLLLYPKAGARSTHASPAALCFLVNPAGSDSALGRTVALLSRSQRPIRVTWADPQVCHQPVTFPFGGPVLTTPAGGFGDLRERRRAAEPNSPSTPRRLKPAADPSTPRIPPSRPLRHGRPLSAPAPHSRLSHQRPPAPQRWAPPIARGGLNHPQCGGRQLTTLPSS